MKINKKTLFLAILICVILPIFVFANQSSPEVPATLSWMVTKIKDVANTIGVTLVVVGWIIAGILFLTSGGSTEKTTTAKKAIFAALIGTVLIALANVAMLIVVNALALGQ